jgi:hypothetical protein
MNELNIFYSNRICMAVKMYNVNWTMHSVQSDLWKAMLYLYLQNIVMVCEVEFSL